MKCYVKNLLKRIVAVRTKNWKCLKSPFFKVHLLNMTRVNLPDMVDKIKLQVVHYAIHFDDFRTCAITSAPLCCLNSCTSHEANPYLHRTCDTRSQCTLSWSLRLDLLTSHGHFFVVDWMLLCIHKHLKRDKSSKDHKDSFSGQY